MMWHGRLRIRVLGFHLGGSTTAPGVLEHAGAPNCSNFSWPNLKFIGTSFEISNFDRVDQPLQLAWAVSEFPSC
jgi:hypothetical protein